MHWKPPVALSKQEEFILKRLGRVRTLLPFLRLHRHELFDSAFQAELDGMYRASGAGKERLPPALLALATLVQGYLDVSDAEMVELTLLDLSVQCVLGCVGASSPPFSQGALHDFRLRLIARDMDQRLLERTVELARKSGGFDAKKLPKSLRVAVDSSPLEGVGRVEDTLNLLAHAGRDIARFTSKLLGLSIEDVCRTAGASLLIETSVKKALDLQWNRPGQRDEGLRRLVAELDSLVSWVNQQLPLEVNVAPLCESLATLKQIRDQDLEPDPSDPGGGLRILRGVAKDRRVSITDKEMRHGRKNKNKTFSGYKRHVAADLDTDLILAGAVSPANVHEQEALRPLDRDVRAQGFSIGELYVDRGYITSPVVAEIQRDGGAIVCRPWMASRGGLFSKIDFHFDLRSRSVMCPAGVEIAFQRSGSLKFPAELCRVCPLRSKCTTSKAGRCLTLADDEVLQEHLRRALKTPSGRQRLRRRTKIEHQLARVSRRNGTRARFRGIRKNTFALRRTSAVLNLETIRGWQLRGIRSVSNHSAS